MREINVGRVSRNDLKEQKDSVEDLKVLLVSIDELKTQ